MYRPILSFLLFFGLETYPILEMKRTKMVGYICIPMFYVVSVGLAMTGILLVDGILRGLTQYSLSAFATMYVGFAFRWILQRNGKAIFDLLLTMCEFKGVSPKKVALTRKVLYTLSVLVVMVQLLALVLLLQPLLGNLNSKVNASKVFTGYSTIFKEVQLGVVAKLWILSVVLMYVHNVIPFCLFGILYAVISWHLREILKHFKGSLRLSHPKLSECSETYNRISSLVIYADKTLNSLMGISVFYISCALYFTVFNVLPDRLSITHNGIISTLNIIFMGIFLYGMLYFASEIPTIVADISRVIHSMVADNDSIMQKVELLIYVNQGIFLSVGQMVIIRKGLFLVIIGTIATYCILINSFPKKSM
ncbi:hypothetical protein JTE90_022771 [Oedothorax gibbosus]|uniref:Gustatory receptor n=1 Tax=Oedothorax gibbosus TaxID=931172 RepID=A0AAV6U8P0_9ARAC|nr:hypothetical protein JTE90_022771 [Oedothorax gibbosus]